MKTFLKTLAVTVVALALAACSQFKSEGQKVMAACATVTASLTTLTLFQEQLTVDQKKRVVYVLDTAVTPVCGSGAEPTYDTVKLTALIAAQNELANLANKVKK